MIRRYAMPILLVLATVGMPAALRAAPMFAITDLGTLPAGDRSFALDVNNRRQVTGNARTTTSSTPLHAMLWQNGSMADLGILAGSDANFSRGYAINDAGVVVGESSNNTSLAFRWENGVMTNLGNLGNRSAVAHDINNSGVVVGGSSNGQNLRAFWWENGAMSDLGTPAGTASARARAWAINDDGDVAGVAHNAAGNSRPALWRGGPGGTVQTLPTLGNGDQFGEALAIADNDWVVGYSNITGSTEGAFLWREAVGTVFLGNLGFRHSRATDVNDRGQIVGFGSAFSNFPSFGGAAFLWENEVLFDLNGLIPAASGWTLYSAEGINDQGDIVGYGLVGGQQHGFLLTRIPEPGPIGLLTIGSLALAAGVRRRKPRPRRVSCGQAGRYLRTGMATPVTSPAV